MRIDSRIPKVHQHPRGGVADAWELIGGELVPVENSFTISGDSCWQSDNAGDIMPQQTPSAETLWEPDGNGDLQPV